MILNPQQYDIVDQIALFAEAKEIIAAHGSSLANIIFCKKGTTIYEIRPQFDKDYEVNLSNRYNNLFLFINPLIYLLISFDNFTSLISSKFFSQANSSFILS